MSFHIAYAADRTWEAVSEVPGLEEAMLVDRHTGPSVHFEVVLARFAPGAALPSHIQPFEESWYVLEGGGAAVVDGLGYDLGVGDYAVVGVGHPHRFTAGDDGALVLTTRAPRPSQHQHVPHLVPAPEVEPIWLGRPSETDPRHRGAGHFDDGDLAPYAALSMPGYHGPNIQNISVHMMVDRLLGAQHHTLFMVEFSGGAGEGKAAREHFHPFEEIYFLVGGTARGTLDGQDVVVSAGDMVWTGVDSLHGFINEHDEPVRWIEAQSPVPPDSDAFFFPDDWQNLA